MTTDDLLTRLAALEARVAELESYPTNVADRNYREAQAAMQDRERAAEQRRKVAP